jgi:hypothetical protein
VETLHGVARLFRLILGLILSCGSSPQRAANFNTMMMFGGAGKDVCPVKIFVVKDFSSLRDFVEGVAS